MFFSKKRSKKTACSKDKNGLFSSCSQCKGNPKRRALQFEPLEDRQMLSVVGWEQREAEILESGGPVPSEYLAGFSVDALVDSPASKSGDGPLPASGDATISWIGGEGDWDDPAMWDMERVPASYDSVAIPDADATVHLSGNIEVRSLESSGLLSVDSGLLTLSGESELGGVVYLAPNTGLAVTDNVLDEDPTCVVSGDLFMDGASLFAYEGATMSAPTLRSYSHGSTGNSQVHGFQAQGENSTISLPNLEMVVGGTHYGSDVLIEASDGASIAMPLVRQLLDVNSGNSDNRAFLVRAMDAGSSIDLSGLLSIVDLDSGSKTGNGEYSRLYVSGGGTILAPSLENMSGVYYDLDATSTADLSGLASATSGRFEIDQHDTAFGNLTDADGTDFVVSESDVQLPSLESLENGLLQLTLESTVQADALSDIDGSDLFVGSGSALSLPGVLTYEAGSGDRSFHVEGVATTLALPNLEYLLGGSAKDADVSLEAISEGRLDLPSLRHIVDSATGDSSYRKIRVLSHGTESRIDLSGLLSFRDRYGTAETGAGEWSELIEAEGGTIDVAWDTVELAGVNITRDATGKAADFLPPKEDSGSAEATLPGDDGGKSDEGTLDGTKDPLPTKGLEQQNLWIGESGDWSEPTNWSQGSVPDITDSVVIPEVEGLTITINSSVVVGDLDCSAALNLTGGTLRVKGTATLAGEFTAAAGTTLIAEGAQATITASGVANVNGVSLWALGGGVISLPTVTAYENTTSANHQDRSFIAEGLGSRIELPNATSVTGGTHYDSDLTIKALSGGIIRLPQVTQISDSSDGDSRRRSIQVIADGWDSRIELDTLMEFTDPRGSQTNNGDGEYSRLHALAGGTIKAPSFETSSGVWLMLNEESDFTGLQTVLNGRFEASGAISLSQLQSVEGSMHLSDKANVSLTHFSTMDDVDVYVREQSVLSLPSVTNITAIGDTVWKADGPGSRIDLSNLTMLDTGESASQDCFIQAFDGGEIDLSSVQSIMDSQDGSLNQRSVRIKAEGTGSIVRLDSLEVLEDRYAGDTTHDDSWDSWYGLINCNESSRMEVLSGGTIQLGSLSTAVGVYMRIDDGTLDTGTIETISGNSYVFAGAGTSDFASLTDFTSSTLVVDSEDVDFSQLNSADNSSITVNATGIIFPLLTSMEDGRLTTGGAIPELPLLGSIDGTDLYANDGGQIILPSVTNITAIGDTVWKADGPGSRIDLSNLTMLDTGESASQDCFIQAFDGGEIDLSSVQSIMDSQDGSLNQRSVRIKAEGTGSIVRLDSLEVLEDRYAGDTTHDDSWDSWYGLINCNESSRMEVLSGGTIQLGSLSTAVGVYMRIDDGTLDTGTIETISGNSYVFAGAGTSDFASLTDFTSSTLVVDSEDVDFSQLNSADNSSITVNATGIIFPLLTSMEDGRLTTGGAIPELPLLGSIDGTDLYANDGGQIILPSVTNITAIGDTVWKADGPGSRIDLSNLTMLDTGESASQDCFIQAFDGGEIDLSSVQSIMDSQDGSLNQRSVRIKAEGTGSIVRLDSLEVLEDRYAGDTTHDDSWDSWYGLINCNESSRMEVLSGGTIQLGSLSTAVGVYMRIDDGTLDTGTIETISGNSYVFAGAGTSDFASLTDFTSSTLVVDSEDVDFSQLNSADNSSITVNATGIIFPLLTSMEDGRLTTGGAIPELPLLGSIDGTDLYANDGGQIILPSVTNITAIGDTVWKADGPGSRIDLSNLTMLDTGESASQDCFIQAFDGGEIDLSSVQSIMDSQDGSLNQRSVRIKAEGTGSIVRLDSLEVLEDRYAGDTTHDDSWDSWYGLINCNESSRMEVLSGGTIQLGSLSTAVGVYMRIDDGTLDTGTIETISGNSYVFAGAGTSDFASLTDFTSSTLVVDSEDVDFSQLNSADNSSITVNATGIIFPLLTSMEDGRLTTGGAIPELPLLGSIDGTDLYANDGGQIILPSVTNITAIGDTVWKADGPGSRIDLSNLTMLDTGESASQDCFIQAFDGGEIDLSSVQSIMDSQDGSLNQRSVRIKAEGTGSIVRLDSLEVLEDRYAGDTTHDDSWDSWYGLINCNESSRMEVLSGGTIQLGSLSTAVGVYMRIDDGTLDTGTIETISGNSELIISGGPVDLSQVQTIYKSTLSIASVDIVLASAQDIRYSSLYVSTGSEVHFPAVTNIDGTSISVSDGSVLAFPALTSISHASTGNSQTRQFAVSGSGSLLDLSSVENISSGTHYGSRISVEATEGATLDLSGLEHYEDQQGGDNRYRSFDVVADGADSRVLLNGLQEMRDLSTSTNPANSHLSQWSAVDSGEIVVGEGNELQLYGTTLTLEDGGQFTGDLKVSSSAYLVGSGTIEGSVDNRGRVNPTGFLYITDSYTQSALASIRTSIGGPLEGEYGRGVVTETARIDGIAEAELTGGFVPETGDVYNFLSASEILGQFRRFVDVNSGGGWGFEPEYISDAEGDRVVLNATFSTGARVTAVTPQNSLSSALTYIDVTFSEPIQPATLTAEVVELLDPMGNPVAIGKPYQRSGNTYRIPVQQQQFPGEYTLRVGPEVLDLGGNVMNQNGDQLNGEEDDAFVHTFELIDVFPPDVVSVSPNGLTNTPVDTITVNFTEAIDPATVGVDDLTLTGPNGPVDLSGAVITPVTGDESIEDNQRFTVTLDALTEEGLYELVVRTDVTDPLGNPGTDKAILSQFLLDTTRPAIAGSEPVGDLGYTVDQVVLTLSEPIQPDSLTPDLFTLTGPNGDEPVSSVELIDDTTVLVRFAEQSTNGKYLLHVAPGITDPAGNQMEDPYQAQFDVRLPDFSVSDVTTTETSATFGSNLEVQWRLDNLEVDSVVPSEISYEILLTQSGNDVPVHAGTVPAANLGLQSTSVPLPLLEGLLPGDYQITVRVNPDETQAEPDLANNASTSAATISLDYPELPDLAVSNIATSDAPLPGSEIVLTYDVTNGSLVPAEGDWTERVYISTDSVLDDADVLLDEFARSETLGNETAARDVSVTIPETGFSGDVYFIVEIDTSESTVFEQSRENNIASSESPFTVPNQLALHADRTQVREADGTKAVRVVLSRYGDIASDLVVTVESNDTGELTVPENVTIPAGIQSVTFWADAVSDLTPDGSVPVELSATADNFDAAATTVTVIDSDTPSLQLQLSATEATEGDILTATVESNVTPSQEVLITLISVSASQFDFPETIVIPAGQTSVTFEIPVVDNTRSELSEEAWITARAYGYEDDSAGIMILDDDEPELTLTLSTDTISEADGPMAMLATISRAVASSTSLQVSLSLDDPSQARVPSIVVIPAGQSQTTFYVSPIADGWADGRQTVTLTASAIIESCGCAATAGSAAQVSQTFTVEDSDSASLFVDFNRDLFAEGIEDVAIATITRNGPTDDPLTLLLTTDNDDELAWTEPVIIPAGESTITVPLDTVYDDVQDGSQTVRLTVSADGYISGWDSVVVTDIDLADLVVDSITLPADAETESYVDVTYRLANEGIWEAASGNADPDEGVAGSWTQRVFLSTDAYIGDDILVGSYSFVGTIPVDQWFERTIPVEMPMKPGEYWIVVQTDATNLVEEGVETNNLLISSTPITVEAAYSATVECAVDAAPAGSTVEFTGHATDRDGGPAAFVPVNLHITVRGITRVISAVTDENGDFTASFQPLSSEAGQYTVGATHPGISEAIVQDSFTLFGMRVEPGSRSVTIIEEGTSGSSFTIRNMSDIPLTGLSFEVLNEADNLDIELIPPESDILPGSGTQTLRFNITANDASIISGRMVMRIMADDVETIQVPVDFRVKPLVPNIVSTTSRIRASMLRGEPRVIDVTVSNNGGRETGPMDLLLPNASWLSVVTDEELPSLAPGESTTVSLLLTPPADMELTEYKGTIQFRADADHLNIPFTFRAVSEAVGSLSVIAFDDLFFYTSEAPKLADARVRIVDAVSGNQVALLTTDETGGATIDDLPEGYYDIEVRADKHNKYTQTLYLEPGTTNTVRAFLPKQTVTYTWTVVPVEIEDRYEITINTVFETNVPAPSVSISPGVIDVSSLDVPGDHMQVNVTLTNSGNIAAPDVELHFDEHPMYRFTPLVEYIGDLAAKSSMVIPVRIERLSLDGATDATKEPGIQAGGQTFKGLSYAAAATTSSSVPCTAGGGVTWKDPCTWEVRGNSTRVTGIDADCSSPANPFSPLPYVNVHVTDPGIHLGGPVLTSSTPSVLQPACDPCVMAWAKALLGCGTKWIPTPAWYSCIKSAKKCDDTIENFSWEGAYGCVKGTVVSCAKALGKTIPGPWKAIKVVECLWEFKKAYEFCRSLDDGGSDKGLDAAGLAGLSMKGSVGAEVDALYDRISRLEKVIDAYSYGFGDQAWLDIDSGIQLSNWLELFETSISGELASDWSVTESERLDLLAATISDPLDASHANAFIDRWNRTMDYWSQGIVNLADVPSGMSDDFIAFDIYRTKIELANSAIEESEAEGYLDLIDAIDASRDRLLEVINAGLEGVCSTVKIQIEQEAVITRDAFEATLEFDNGTDDVVKDVNVDVLITDADGARCYGPVRHLRPLALRFLWRR